MVGRVSGATRILATVALTVLWAAATVAVLALLGPDWARYAPATCLGTHCFCEFPRAGSLILQPADTWSSFGYVAVGSWIMTGALRPARPTAFAGPGVVWYGFAAVVIGVGSALLHATLTLWGQFADVVGMYLLTGFALTWAVARWRGLAAVSATLFYLALCTGLIVLLYLVPEARRWAFLVLLIVAIIVEMALARPRRPGVRPAWFVAGIAAKAVAFGIWILDNTLTVCAAHSLVQGHAVWHLLGAAAVLCSFIYYRSERPAPAAIAGRRGLL